MPVQHLTRCSLSAGVCLSILVGTLSAGAATSDANKTVPFYDGRSVKVTWSMTPRKGSIGKTEDALISKEIFPKAKKHWQGEESPDLSTLAVLPGSFTSKGAKQELIFYQYYSGSADGIYGMAVIQDGKIIVNYTYRGGEAAKVRVLPDLNDDGRNEVAIEHWSMHQGYRSGGITVLELGNKDIKKFGQFQIAEDDLNTETYYKFELAAKTGSAPQFQSSKYQKRHNKWTKIGKTKAVTPGEDGSEYIAL